MKNKILLLLVACSVLLAVSASAQQKPLDFSIKIYGGYGVVQPGNDVYFVYQADAINNSINSFDYKNIKMNLGRSPHYGGGVSLKLNDQFSVGLDADYLTGSKNYTYTFDFSSGSQATSYHVLSFIPNISYGIWSQPKYSIYNTLGIVAAVATKLNINYLDMSSNESIGSFDNQVDKFGLSIGLKDAVGIKFGLAKNLHGFAEVSGFFLAVTPKSRTITDDEGMDTQTITNSGSPNFTDTGVNTQPNEKSSYNQSPSNPYHFSSIGLNIGIIIDLKK